MLELDGATKRFGGQVALDTCPFVARPGRLTGFLGPNGAGKTTAMRTVFGLVELDAGVVRWRGEPIGPEERAQFGYMPEERGLYPRMRVRDQLVYLGRLCGRPLRAVERTVHAWLDRLGLAARAKDRLDALSHGNQQRVQLIAALVNEPDLLVLDEPFAGLDPLAMASMSALLAEVAAAGATVLFSSHQLNLVEDICEDVVIIDAGRVVRAGDLAELRAAVPQRFISVRYRGCAPDWSGVPSVAVVDISPDELTAIVAPVPVTNVELGQVAGRSPDDETAAFIMTVVLFGAITTYGAMVLSGVVEEKSSRTVEVLLARMPARHLLAGKVAGIGVLGLAQVVAVAIVALVAVALVDSVDIPAVRSGVLAWAVVWFVLGYALYATVFGTLGSLASRTEDASSITGPVTIVLVLAFVVSFAAIGSADTTWARLVSWFPLTAPLAMPNRIAMGAATWWDPLVAVVLTLVAIAALVVLGGRIYTRAILHTGSTLTLAEVWRDGVSAGATSAARPTRSGPARP
jgi:ABC-type uncharacterized transport system ATPase subunit